MGIQLRWLYITTFLDLFATSLIIPFLPVHLQAYGLPRLAVGLIASVYPSVQLFSSSAVGFYSLRYGQKFTLIVSLLFCSLAYYLLASNTSIIIIFLCRVILGIVKHTQTICKAIFLSNNETLSKKVGFGGVGAAEALGYMLGPVIGAYFIEREDGFQYLCKITTALFVINAIIVFFVLPAEVRVLNYSTKQSEHVLNICGKSSTRNLNLFWDILVLKLVLCFALSLFYLNYHVIVVKYFSMPPSMVGYTNSFQGLICIITCLSAKKISYLCLLKDFYLKVCFCFLILSSSFFCLDNISHSGTFVTLLIPLSFSSSLLRIYLSEALINLSSTKNKASIIGIENTIATVASLTGPFFYEVFNHLNGSSSITWLPFLISGFGSVLSISLFFFKEKDNLRDQQIES